MFRTKAKTCSMKERSSKKKSSNNKENFQKSKLLEKKKKKPLRDILRNQITVSIFVPNLVTINHSINPWNYHLIDTQILSFIIIDLKINIYFIFLTIFFYYCWQTKVI